MTQTRKKVELSSDLAIGGVSLTQKAVFAKHLAVMLQSGMLITEALDITTSASRGKMRKVLQGVSKTVEAGNGLADGLAKYPRVFSGLFVDVVRAGEFSGNLADNLQNIADQLEKEKNLVSKIRSSMAYPSVILVAAFILSLAMAYYVLPQIIPLFTGLGVELPLTTKIIIAFSELVQNHGGKLFIGIICTILLFIWFVRQKFSQPFIHGVLLHVPILRTISKNTNLARFSLTLGTLLRSGLTIDEALEITTRTVPNFYFRRALAVVQKKIETGAPFALSLAAHPTLFPKLTTSMIHVGEESGKLDDSLLYLANFYELEVDEATKTLTTALEPTLLIIIGLVVGTLALSIITPIYEITGNIR